MHAKLLALLIVALFISSCTLAAKPVLKIEDAWVKAAKVSEITAGDLNNSCICDVKTATFSTNAYMNIQNPSGSPDRLLKAEAEGISRIEFRGSTSAADLTAIPAPLDTIDLPANGSLLFAPGSYAMLLMGMKKDLKPGETLKLSLYFEKAGKIDLTLAIRTE